MNFLKQFWPGSRKTWLLSILTLCLLAAQCNTPPAPPLPDSAPTSIIRIALLFPASGEMATLGRTMRNGSVLAFDRWNDQGGILGHRLEGVVYDTDCRFETAAQAARQAIDDGLDFMIGPLCSEAALAAAQVAESNGALLVAPTATHPLVTVNSRGQTRPTVFRAGHAYSAQGRAAARFAGETLGANKAALFSAPGDDYSAGLADAFAQQFVAQGGEIVYRAAFTQDDADCTGSLPAIAGSGAEVIYLPASAAAVNRVAGQLNAPDGSSAALPTGTGPILLGSDSWESTQLDLSTVTGSYFTTHFAPADPRPAVQSWAGVYKSTYAVEPNTVAALGYDAAMLLAGAIQQSGTFEPADVAKALEQGTFDGVTGQIRFDNQHNPVKPVPHYEN